MIRAAILLSVAGLVSSRTTTVTPDFFPDFFPGELEWDCTDDHRPHWNDTRKFLQSPNGFGPKADIIVSSCPNRWHVFVQDLGSCRCEYAPEVRTLLERNCTERPVSEERPEMYQVLNPSLDVSSVDELFENRTCHDLLPNNIIRFFLGQHGVNPLFFNGTSCRCEYTAASKNITARPIPQGRRCETLVDQFFNSREVTSDGVGNWVDIVPFEYQQNITIKDGGAEFGHGVRSALNWRLMSSDFLEINLIARFSPESGGNKQIVFSNHCDNETANGGFVELQYSQAERRFYLQFFGTNIGECTPPTTSSQGVQTAQVIYNRGVVRLVVNDYECDMGSLNPVVEATSKRLMFSSECPFQLGGLVYTGGLNFGLPNRRAEGFKGILLSFIALRNCPNPPGDIKNKIKGITDTETPAADVL